MALGITLSLLLLLTALSSFGATDLFRQAEEKLAADSRLVNEGKLADAAVVS